MSIWKHQEINKLINVDFQISLTEGETDYMRASYSGIDLIIKQEYLNPNGSFKDRSIAFLVSYLKSRSISKAVISSSGNAALSAAAYCKVAGIKLDVFVSLNVDQSKLSRLEGFGGGLITIHQSDKPKSDAIKFAKESGAYNLRGSTDELAVTGFKTISYELFKQEPNIDSIFIPCSSGTSTLGVFHGYKDLQRDNSELEIPSIHICQTEKIYPIAKEFDADFLRHYSSLASCVSDRVALRKNEIVEVVRRTNGSGWVISDDLLREAKEVAKQLNIKFLSYNSLLSLAGFLKSVQKGYKFKVACLIFSGY